MRMREYSEAMPKPMVPIGYRPILWHVMKYYAHYGHKDFILCLGYKADVIKKYFLEYDECVTNDFVLSGGGKNVQLLNQDIHDWNITFVDTGLASNIGQRLKAVERLVGDDELFLANYTQGLADVSMREVISKLKYRGRVAACVVFGGGIWGLSVAWTILEKRPGCRVAVLEKEDAWAQHQTGRNSGVIHSGIYYKPGSLKAKLCREGNRRLLEFCREHGIRHEVCGKVIVATTVSEIPLMENLYGRGVANGLTVKKLSASEVREIEPNVSCLAGLHVPATGIINFSDVCQKLAELIEIG